MEDFIPACPPFRVSEENGKIVVENEFVRWEHDPARGGELSGAFVKNGSGKNLLTESQYSAISPYVPGGWRQVHEYSTAADKASSVLYSEKNGVCKISFRSGFRDASGKKLAGATVNHDVEYRPDGAAVHTVTFRIAKDLPDIGQIRIGTLLVRNTVDRLAVRPCAAGSWAVELQNPCRWIELKHARSRGDLPAWRSRFLPLSVLLMESGLEGIEMSMGDDLGAWDNLCTDVPGMQQGSVYESRNLTAYEVVFAPLESPRLGNTLKKGTYRFSYRLALPFVRKNIVPMTVGTSFCGPVFENRWPDRAKLAELKKGHCSILRVHNDGDFFGNGIFWRDAAYPPYPADEMAKMDRMISDAEAEGIRVVPYFSCKEYHPEAGGFQHWGEKWARVVIPGEKFLVNFFGTSLFGMQMCLESKWYDKRKESIRLPLENHRFRGLYFDWTMGLECIHPDHMHGRRHWDNDRLLDLMEWSRAKAGRGGALYLHLTNVPSLPLENMADLVLTEESEYTEIFPEMFTPHVPFMNIAPRSICLMLSGARATETNLRALTLCGLLHRVTISTWNPVILKEYETWLPLMNSFTKYTRHAAPGEGKTFTDTSDVGMSAYWTGDTGTALFANLADAERTVNWTLLLSGKKQTGRVTIPALSLAAVPLDLN